MKHTRKTTQLPKVLSLSVLAVLAILAIALSVAPKIKGNTGQALTLSDKTLATGQAQLCSPYAGICFTRPASWTRSGILHVAGKASSTVEINPPTGAILEFAKSSGTTNTMCDKATYKTCLIQVSGIKPLPDQLSVVTGIIIDTPDISNCTTGCTVPKYTPFVQLLSQSELKAYDLRVGAVSPFTQFNPSASIGSGKKFYLGMTPGKNFRIEDAQDWLQSSDATAAQTILASVTRYDPLP